MEGSPWADVLREAEYYLLGGDEGSMQDPVTPLYSRVQAAWGKYSSVVKQCASIDMGAGLCIDTAVKQHFECYLNKAQERVAKKKQELAELEGQHEKSMQRLQQADGWTLRSRLPPSRVTLLC